MSERNVTLPTPAPNAQPAQTQRANATGPAAGGAAKQVSSTSQVLAPLKNVSPMVPSRPRAAVPQSQPPPLQQQPPMQSSRILTATTAPLVNTGSTVVQPLQVQLVQQGGLLQMNGQQQVMGQLVLVPQVNGTQVGASSGSCLALYQRWWGAPPHGGCGDCGVAQVSSSFLPGVGDWSSSFPCRVCSKSLCSPVL